MVKRHCDSCGTETFFNPNEKQVLDDDGKPKRKTIKKWFQELGKYMEIEAAIVEYEKPKYMQVQLHTPENGEWVAKDFCDKCWNEKIKPLSDSLKNLLLSFEDQ
jgi:hypothetical protein